MRGAGRRGAQGSREVAINPVPFLATSPTGEGSIIEPMPDAEPRPLDAIRGDIDAVDRELVRLLSRRADLAMLTSVTASRCSVTGEVRT